MWKDFFRALLQQQQKDRTGFEVARHLSKVLLYELKGADSLYPDVRDKFGQLQRRMLELGKPIFLSDSFRSAKKQNKLSTNVTNAGGLQSYHQYGLAFDVAFVKYRWDPPSKNWWTVLGREGKKVGLTWGGDWGWDFGHFEWHNTFTWKELKPHFIR